MTRRPRRAACFLSSIHINLQLAVFGEVRSTGVSIAVGSSQVISPRYCATQPPSIDSAAPVIVFAAPLHKKTASAPI
jgi:hypothetical protein